MKQICKQCGAEFELSASEIEFYKSKNLSLPKRCKQCRKHNKQQTSNYNNNNNYSNSDLYYNRNTVNNNFSTDNFQSYNNNARNKKSSKKRLAVATALICVLILAVFGISQVILNNYDKILDEYTSAIQPTSAVESINPTTESTAEIITEQITEQQAEESSTAEYQADTSYSFRSYELLQEHYKKHGIEMGFASAEEYLLSANKVINNSSSLHKLEKEDGDDVYYLEASNEFVVVSTDGYIRTYFYPNDGIEYFNRQ